jgi:uncharacterized caspase-like protein
MRIASPLRSLLVAVAAAFGASAGAPAQDRGITVGSPTNAPRHALVIGNAAYADAPLRNPVNDAQDVAQALREVGFQVTLLENQGQIEMKRAIQAFGRRLARGSVGLFYYAGHGVQARGRNWLLPVDAQIANEADVEIWAVETDAVLSQMEEAGSAVNIVILDACRNTPFARGVRSATRGLATAVAPSGSLIAYATAPGAVASDGPGRNGIYTQELLRHLRTTGLTVEEVFKRVRIGVRARTDGVQTPWEASSLTGDFYFLPTAGRAAGTQPEPESRPTPSATVNRPAEGNTTVAQAAVVQAPVPSSAGVEREDRGRYEAALARGGEAYRAGLHEAAERAWLDAVRTGYPDPRARFNMGLLYSEQKRLPEAVRSFEGSLRATGPDAASADTAMLWETWGNAINGLLNVGAQYYQANMLDSARSTFAAVTRLEPHHRSGWYNLALSLYKQQRWDDLVPVARRLIELDSLNYNTWILLFNAQKGLADSAKRRNDPGAEREHRAEAVRALEQAHSLGVSLEGIELTHAPGEARLTGTLRGGSAIAGSSLQIEFTVYGPRSSRIGTKAVLLTLPANQQSVTFGISLATNVLPLSWSYRIVQQ